MPWKAPNRPRENDITQNFDDGVLTVYTATDVAAPGRAPVKKLAKKISLRYQEQRLGIQRYFEALQNQIQVERVVRVPRAGDITNQDVGVTEDGRQYRIDLVQSAEGIYPPCVDLTLAKLVTQYKPEDFVEGET